ncbi:MAG TPA: basic secretory protein-like protein [Myxococcota bacterium]|nr:basic secretory protein-like protein [Myxococcota bacterium]
MSRTASLALLLAASGLVACGNAAPISTGTGPSDLPAGSTPKAPGGGGDSPAGDADGSAPNSGDSPAPGSGTGPGGGTAPAPTAGRAPAGSLDAACTPQLVVRNDDAAGNGRLFTNALPDPNATLSKVTRTDCEVLYRNAGEVPNRPTLTLIIENTDGVAFTVVDEVHLSSRFLADVAGNNGDLTDEISGVLTHEIAHVYQNDNGNYGEITWLVEGIADFVRYRNGFVPLSKRQHGGSYTDSYNTTAFFLDYLDRTYPDFVYKLNAALAPPDKSWTKAYFQTVTGKDVDTLWAEYQRSF